jgi:hypothetical protein
MNRRENLVAFERKEVEKEKPKSILWSILKWYWLLVPTFYFLVIIPGSLQQSEGQGLAPDVAFNLVLQLINYGLAGIMTVTHPLERSKTGLADKFLKAAVAQQFLAQNIFGLILTVIVWYQLPYKVDPELVEPEELEKWHFQQKTIYIIMGVLLGITLLVVLGQFTVN